MILLALMMGCVDPPVVRVDRDNFEIRASARVEIAAEAIVDADDDGVIHIIGDDLIVDFTGAHLHGAESGIEPDAYTGMGVRITGSNNTIRGGRFSGFKVAIFAHDADGLTIEDVDVSDNFRQRLRSTPQAEASEDWLWPHNNDDREWMTNYGGGVSVKSSSNITIRGVRARDVQNGILLSRVNDSQVYDNDCSFLSGWGLALWRSSNNVIARNAFDFCIRGYSHGVYNRGQDSAGILMFEQCSENLIAENSVTHGGDGIFGFAGREALGEVNPREDVEWYERRGNNRNRILRNDLSYAAAHGLEMTFSFDNLIGENHFTGNAICGIWGGFSQNTAIVYNSFSRNGDMPYGSERGGVNIEHGAGNALFGNRFSHNACGVYFWSRDHTALLERPWAKVNHRGSTNNYIGSNTFEGDRIGIQLRRVDTTLVFGNHMKDVETEIDADEQSRAGLEEGPPASGSTPRLDLPGETRPVGARRHLAGRDKIIMTEWGPYNWASPLLHLHEKRGGYHIYRLLGVDDDAFVMFGGSPGIGIIPDEISGRITILPDQPGRITPYWLEAIPPQGPLLVRGVLVPAKWTVRAFGYDTDPREDVEAWRREAMREDRSVEFEMDELNLNYRHAGPSQLPNVPQAVSDADLPRDRFGTIATTRLTFPAGRWRIRTVSDDGIRVWLDEKEVIDDWTWHAPKEHVHEFEVVEDRTIAIRVEHFELDGYAVLKLDVEAVE